MAEAVLCEPGEEKTTPIGALGLTSDEARRRLSEFGQNAVNEVVSPRWRSYLAKFWRNSGRRSLGSSK